MEVTIIGLLTKNDTKLYRNFFKEMSKLRGIRVKYQYIIEQSTSIHAEFNTELSSPIFIDIIFQENPRINTLKSIGWVSENPNDKPYIAILPFDVPNLTTESIITIIPFKEINKPRKFKITSINTILEFPESWTCTLAPIFNTKNIDKDYNESNYNYVDSNYSYISDTNDSLDNGDND